MSFLWAEALWGLLLVPVLVAVYILAQQRRHKYAVRYASLSLVREAIGKGPGARRHIPAALFLLGITVLIVAVARPAATVLLPSQQGTVILTMDVSGSMRATDIQPSRLEAAKAAARAFVENQPRNVRIGVVSFSNNASIVQAPTTDRAAVLEAINRLSTQRSTAIGSGILTSLDAIFENSSASATTVPRDPLAAPAPTVAANPVPRGSHASAVVVLLSDGQSNTGPRPLDAVKQAVDRGVRVFTVGVGSPSGIVAQFDGRSVRVRLDEDTLKQIAEETDADYYRANSETDLRSIYQKLSTEMVFKTEQTELTAWFAAAAGVIMLVAGALSLAWLNRLP